ncbi:MAG TPA: class III extradiol ring-cleavage dioxygenase [Candidatus Competibacteraceae bacterium]|nr:class III extradiol ring-cleavage dioxygenase [Candidatus Competibacteraceae bacterium]
MNAFLPPVFLSHGSPTFALEDRPVSRFWRSLPARLSGAPRAILCVSAHWCTRQPALAGGMDGPLELLHDFYGFPEPLYRLTWPVCGSAALAGEIVEVLAAAGIAVVEQPQRPLDHGVWVPLRAAWPEPPMPVLALSVCPQRDGAWHLALGRALAPLAQRGIWVVGSGGLVHNLRRLDWGRQDEGAEPWAAEFFQAWRVALAQGDLQTLCDPQRLPHGRVAAGDWEHYVPVLVALGAGSGAAAQWWHESWAYGCLDGSVLAFAG